MSTTVHRFVERLQPLINLSYHDNNENIYNMYPTSADADAFVSNQAATTTSRSGADFSPFLPCFSPATQLPVVDALDLLKKVLANLMLVSGQCPDVLTQTFNTAVLSLLLTLSDQPSARIPQFPECVIPPLLHQQRQTQPLFPGNPLHGALSTLESPISSTPTSPTMLKPVAVFPGALSAINLPLFGMGPVSPLSSQMSDQSSSFFSSGTPSLYSGSDSRRLSLQSEGDVKYQQPALFLPGAPQVDTVLATAAAANIFATEQRQNRGNSIGGKPQQQQMAATSESISFEANIPCSSRHVVDDSNLDLEPATTLRGGPSVNKLLLAAKTTEYPEACSSPGARKRYQNRLAAYRYRLKRKFQREKKYCEVISLSRRNKDLKTELTNLEREISYLKDLTISIPSFMTAATSFEQTTNVIVTK